MFGKHNLLFRNIHTLRKTSKIICKVLLQKKSIIKNIFKILLLKNPVRI